MFCDDIIDIYRCNEEAGMESKPDERLRTVIQKVDPKKVPERVLPANVVNKYAIDNMVHLLTCPPGKEMKTGISGRRIIGIIKDPELGISRENIIMNPEFRKFVYELAKGELSSQLLREINSSQIGAAAIIDERTASARGDIANDEIIGVFKKDKDGKITFESNPNFAIISRFGLCRLTQGIREKLDNLPN
jgi:hypothetical protein